MKKLFSKARQLVYGATAIGLAVAVGGPALIASPALADQVTTRSVEMSSATPSASNVRYSVTFTPAKNVTNPDILIDFCANSPLIDFTCTATAGTNVPNFSSASAGVNWTLSTIGSGRGVKLTTTTQSLVAGTPVTITLTGVTNPSATATFYGRIITYATGAAGAHTSDSTGGDTVYKDYGGVALSTSPAITVTALVQEQLTFCVSAVAMGSNCLGQTAPSVQLGNGTPVVLSSSEVDAASAYTQTITNATSGVVVRMHSSNSCAGLSTNGGADSCPIAAVGGSTVAKIAAGSKTFGLCVTPGSAASTATVPYNNSGASPDPCLPTSAPVANTNTYFGMDDSGTTGVTSTYGSQIFQVNGPTTGENDTCTFAATSSPTTPAGAYTANESLIATGTF